MEDEAWVTVSLRAVPGASMSEFGEGDEGRKGGGAKKHHRRIPSAIAFAEAKAMAAKGMAPPVPSVSRTDPDGGHHWRAVPRGPSLTAECRR